MDSLALDAVHFPDQWDVDSVNLPTRTVRKDHPLVCTGEVPEEAFIVVRGELTVQNEVMGESTNVITLGRGCILGEIPLLMGKASTCDIVVSSEEATVHILRREVLERELFEAHPLLQRLMIHVAKQFNSPFYEYISYIHTLPPHADALGAIPIGLEVGNIKDLLEESTCANEVQAEDVSGRSTLAAEVEELVADGISEMMQDDDLEEDGLPVLSLQSLSDIQPFTTPYMLELFRLFIVRWLVVSLRLERLATNEGPFGETADDFSSSTSSPPRTPVGRSSPFSGVPSSPSHAPIKLSEPHGHRVRVVGEEESPHPSPASVRRASLVISLTPPRDRERRLSGSYKPSIDQHDIPPPPSTGDSPPTPQRFGRRESLSTIAQSDIQVALSRLSSAVMDPQPLTSPAIPLPERLPPPGDALAENSWHPPMEWQSSDSCLARKDRQSEGRYASLEENQRRWTSAPNLPMIIIPKTTRCTSGIRHMSDTCMTATSLFMEYIVRTQATNPVPSPPLHVILKSLESSQPVTTTALDSWNFHAHIIRDASLLIDHVIDAFKRVGLVEHFHLDWDMLRVFLSRLRDTYRPNPYHNFHHAVDVTITSHWLIMRAALWNYLTAEDLLGLLLGAYGHDAGHPGHNNQFEIERQTPLAKKYNNLSVLENFHLRLTIKILRESHLLDHLPRVAQKDIEDAISAAILGTDMGKHFRIIQEAEYLGDTLNKPFDLKDRAERHLLICLILKAADISNPAKHPSIAVRWAKCHIEELCLQNAEEEKLHLTSKSFSVNLVQSQIDFINACVKPLFLVIVRSFPSLTLTLTSLTLNLKKYISSQRKKSLGGVSRLPSSASSSRRSPSRVVPPRP